MHNRDKHPEIFAAQAKAIKELDPLMAKRQVHCDAMKPLRAEQGELKIKINKLNDKSLVDIKRIRELRVEIGNYATAMGAKGLTAEPIGG